MMSSWSIVSSLMRYELLSHIVNDSTSSCSILRVTWTFSIVKNKVFARVTSLSPNDEVSSTAGYRVVTKNEEKGVPIKWDYKFWNTSRYYPKLHYNTSNAKVYCIINSSSSLSSKCMYTSSMYVCTLYILLINYPVQIASEVLVYGFTFSIKFIVDWLNEPLAHHLVKKIV